MSVWTEVNGTISMHVDMHISLKTYIKEYFLEVVISKCEYHLNNDTRNYSVTFSFCDEGISAAKSVQGFINKLTSDLKAKSYLTALINF